MGYILCTIGGFIFGFIFCYLAMTDDIMDHKK